jgi:hypothetical protein
MPISVEELYARAGIVASGTTPWGGEASSVLPRVYVISTGGVIPNAQSARSRTGFLGA